MKKALILIPLLSINIVSAQLPSVSQWNHLEFENKLLNHVIPIWLFNSDSVNLGNSTVSYFNRNSNFKDVYTPKTSKGFEIASQRYVALNDWKFYGQFSFSKYEDRGTQFSTMANPYRDNPYKIADSVTNANWNKQHYLLEAKILTPELIKNFKTGLGIKYEVLNGARQIDPRPSDKLIDLELTPQIIYKYQNWNVGINGYYNRFREDLNISLQNIQLSKNIYKQLGLGEYLYNGPIILSSGASRFYQGNTFGGGLSVSNQLSKTSFLQLSAHLKSIKEETTDGTTTPFNAGHHQKDELTGILTYLSTQRKTRHLLSFEAIHSKSKNTEFVQFLNDKTFQYEVLHSSVMHVQTKNKASLDYKMLLTNNQSLNSWDLGVNITYLYLDEVYSSTSSNMNLSHTHIAAYAKKWLTFNSFSLALSYKTAYKKVGSHDLQFIPNPKTSNFVARQILYPNYYFNTTDSWMHKIELQLTLPAFEKRQSQMYIKSNIEHTNAANNKELYIHGLSNNFFNITIGLYN